MGIRGLNPSNRETGFEPQLVFVLILVLAIPLHGAPRAMAAALPLPLAGQRWAFHGIPLSYSQTTGRVIVRVS